MESMIKLLRLAIKLGNVVVVLDECLMVITLPNGKSIRVRNYKGSSSHGHFYAVMVKRNKAANWHLTAQMYGYKDLRDVVVQLIQELS